MKPILSSAVAVLCIHLTACSRHSPNYTEDDVRDFVLPGTSRQAIVKRFGSPIHVQKNPKFEKGSTNDIDAILYFETPLPNPLTNQSWAFSGFQVWLKDDKAVKWLASHRDLHIGP